MNVQHAYNFFVCQLFQSTGMIKSGRLLFTRKQTAPSIPTPGQSYGYDETGDGDLTPQPLPPQDSTMGPAYYNVSHVQTYRYFHTPVFLPCNLVVVVVDIIASRYSCYTLIGARVCTCILSGLCCFFSCLCRGVCITPVCVICQ